MTTKDEVPLPQKISASFQQLAAAATQLNTVSDELGKSITALNTLLQGLNLGITTWVPVTGYTDQETGYSYTEQLGYTKIASRWGIALRTVEGNEYTGEPPDIEQWLFSDAPRQMRVHAIDDLPDLLDKLVKEANSTAQQIQEKIGRAQEVASAMTSAAAELRAQRRKEQPARSQR